MKNWYGRPKVTNSQLASVTASLRIVGDAYTDVMKCVPLALWCGDG